MGYAGLNPVTVRMCTCGGRGQFGGIWLSGSGLAGAGAQQLDIIGRKPAYLSLFPSSLHPEKICHCGCLLNARQQPKLQCGQFVLIITNLTVVFWKKKKKTLRILQSSWTFGGIGDFSCIIPVSVMVLSAVCLCVCVWSADVAIVEKLMLWSDEHTSAHKNIDIHVRIISWSTIDWVDGALFICVSCKLHPTFFGWDFKQNSSLMTKYVSDLREGFSV